MISLIYKFHLFIRELNEINNTDLEIEILKTFYLKGDATNIMILVPWAKDLY